MIQYTSSRQGDTVTVRGLQTNRFKRPEAIQISTTEQAFADTSSPILEGDVVDVQNTLGNIAEIAWDMGWRPWGLNVIMGQVVQNYKIPPVTERG